MDTTNKDKPDHHFSATNSRENTLQNAPREIMALFENINEVLFSFDMEQYQCTWMTTASEKVHGRAPAEFLANPNLWFEIILDEDRPIILENNVLLAQGRNVVQEYRIYHKDGSVRWLESKLDPTLNKNGKLIRIDGILSDITKRKEAEIALKKSEYKMRSLMQNSSDAITVINENFEVLFASDSMPRITGFSTGDVMGRTFYDFVHPDDKEAAEKYFEDLLNSSGEPKKLIYRTLKKDGTYFWCERIGANLLSNPAVGGIISNYRDISDRKNVEDQLQIMNDNLQKSNMELDRFVYSVSHDLRAPLSSMLGVVGLIELKDPGQDIMEDLDLLKKSITRLDKFILEILDYSKNARSELNIEEVSFNKELTDIINNIRFMTGDSGAIDIRTHINNELPFYSDRGRVCVILSNLISNAIHYRRMDDPYVDITVEVSKHEARIIIADNGVGIAKENHEKVFEMFRRVSKKSTGSGLGLYIVMETVQKLNGSIHLDSEPGKGTTITVTLPDAKTNPV